MTRHTGLRVAELAASCRVSPDTVRYYERAGLLRPPPRTAAGYRLYGPEAVDRLTFVRGAQRLGLRLRDIRHLLAVRDTGTCPCEPAEELLRRRVAEVDAELVAMAATMPGPGCPPGPADDGCGCPAERPRAPGAHRRPRGGDRYDHATAVLLLHRRRVRPGGVRLRLLTGSSPAWAHRGIRPKRPMTA